MLLSYPTSLSSNNVISKYHFLYKNFSLPAAAAKSLQSCPTLWVSTDGSPPGSPIPGILQARTLKWVAISFSNAWKWKGKVKSLSRVWLTRRHWHPTPVLLPGKPHGRRSLVGYSPWVAKSRTRLSDWRIQTAQGTGGTSLNIPGLMLHPFKLAVPQQRLPHLPPWKSSPPPSGFCPQTPLVPLWNSLTTSVRRRGRFLLHSYFTVHPSTHKHRTSFSNPPASISWPVQPACQVPNLTNLKPERRNCLFFFIHHQVQCRAQSVYSIFIEWM